MTTEERNTLEVFSQKIRDLYTEITFCIAVEMMNIMEEDEDIHEIGWEGSGMQLKDESGPIDLTVANLEFLTKMREYSMIMKVVGSTNIRVKRTDTPHVYLANIGSNYYSISPPDLEIELEIEV